MVDTAPSRSPVRYHLTRQSSKSKIEYFNITYYCYQLPRNIFSHHPSPGHHHRNPFVGGKRCWGFIQDVNSYCACMELPPAAVIHILIFNQRLYLYHNTAMNRTLPLGAPVVKYRSFRQGKTDSNVRHRAPQRCIRLFTTLGVKF